MNIIKIIRLCATNSRLQRRSLSLQNLKIFFEDKSIAIVGNAQSIFKFEYGGEIDSHDIVIRFNLGKIVKPECQGTKTTIWGQGRAQIESKASEFFPNPPVQMWLLSPQSSLYPIPKKLDFFFYSANYLKEIEKISIHPSVGTRAIHFILSHLSPRNIDLYGFDFFRTFNIYQPNGRSAVPHDFTAEEEYIQQLVSEGKAKLHGEYEASAARVLAKLKP